MFGATPCNVAHKLVDGVNSRLITGVNLPMLLRARELPPRAAGRPGVPRSDRWHAGVMQVAVTAPQNQPRRNHDQDNTTISNKLGLHARASAKLTKLAGSFPARSGSAAASAA